MSFQLKISPYLVDSIISQGLKKQMVENGRTHSGLYYALNWRKLGCPLFGIIPLHFAFQDFFRRISLMNIQMSQNPAVIQTMTQSNINDKHP